MINSYLSLAAFRSRVRVWTPERPEDVVEGCNLVTYQGADIVARLLAGQGNYRIARMWFEFDNGGPAVPLPARADTAASVIAATTGTRDIVRGALVSQPLLASSGPDYAGNRGTYHAVTPAGAVGEVNANGFSAGDGSQIIALCLVASPLGPLITDDLVYARYALPSALAVGTSGQVAATWMTEAA
jgi:hypothetical protein